MRTFADVLHVLSAVMLVGPLMVAPFVGRRAIQRRSAEGVRMAANQMRVYGFGSILTAALGVWVTLLGDKHKLADPWIVVSMTLYAVAVCLVFFYAIPALRRAARMVEAGVIARPDEEDSPHTLTASTTDLETKEQLDAITGRVGLAALLVVLVFAIITALMTIFSD